MTRAVMGGRRQSRKVYGRSWGIEPEADALDVWRWADLPPIAMIAQRCGDSRLATATPRPSSADYRLLR